MPHFERHELDGGKPKKTRSLPTPHKQNEKRVEKKLVEIYENADGSMPDMLHIDRRERRRFRRAFVTLLFSCVFLGGVAWAGFFVFQPKTVFQEDDIILSVSGPESATIGEDVRYRIRYRNTQSTAMERAILQVRYPEGFALGESSRPATSTSQDEWDLGTIDPDEGGYIDVSGRMYGELTRAQSFRVFLNYTPTNFSSEFQKVATASVVMQGAPIAVSFAGKSDIVSGNAADVSISVKPPDGKVFDHIAVDVVPSPLFNKTKAAPAEDAVTPYRWSFEQLTGEQTITLSGTFVGTSDAGIAETKVIVRGWKDATRSGAGYVYAEGAHTIKIVKTPITLALAINGTLTDMPIAPGDILNASLLVRNEGATAVDHIIARVVFDAPSYDRQSILEWKIIDDLYDGTVTGEQLAPDTRRGVITWDAAKIPALRTLKPGDEVIIDFHLPVKNAEDVDLSEFTTAKIIAGAEIQTGRGKEKQILGTNPITMTILSDASFETTDTVDTINGKEIHTLSWLIENSFHELSNIQVEADVYGDVFVNTTTLQAPAGEVAWDQPAKKIRWTVPSMPTSLDVLALEIPIVLQSKNPTQKNLTSKISFKATDTVAGQEILKVGDEVLLQ